MFVHPEISEHSSVQPANLYVKRISKGLLGRVIWILAAKGIGEYIPYIWQS